jgi:hypothetical protein
MGMRRKPVLLGLLWLTAGVAVAAGQVERNAETDRLRLDDLRAISPGEPHPLIERQHQVQRRTDLINDLPDVRRSRQQAKPKKYKTLAATAVERDTAPPAKRAGRYQVIAAPEGTLLLDSQSGRTWRLELRRGDAPVWTPIDRDDD